MVHAINNYSLSVINFVYPSGDYAVLIKSGIHWFTALLFNLQL